ncbi:MAG: hypothetical protein KJN62_02285, partial [Deltaproteobacteria bacterium]|nr:hypothetical protein [Deltaproteobacteria bacterium]
LKQCFEDIRRELHLGQSKSIQFKVGNEWVDTDPRTWAKNRKPQVKIGIGNADKIKRKASLSEVLQLQEKAAGTGYMTPQHAYNTISDMMDLDGMDVTRYFPNPETFQPPEPQPNPLVMIEQQKLQLKQQEIQVDSQKSQAEIQLKMMVEQSKDRQAQMKTEIEALKNQYQLQKMVVDEQSQIMNAKTASVEATVNSEVKMRDQELKERIASLEIIIEQQKLAQAEYEAQLKATTALEVKEMEVTQKSQSDLLKHIQSLASMMQSADKEREEQRNRVMRYIKENGSDKMKSFAGTLNKEA